MRKTHPKLNVWGLFMLVLGLWWFVGELGLAPFEWHWAGPLALIAVGVSMVLGRRDWLGDCAPTEPS